MAGLTAAEAALFKAYDIRGRSPEPLGPELAYRVGRAFAETVGSGRIGLARDMRRTSPALAAAFAEGLTRSGAELVHYGLLATDAMWFAVRRDRLDGGAVVTASHNPPGDNGIKLVERDAAPVFAENRLPEVARRTAALPPPPPDEPLPTDPDLHPARDLREDYLDFLLGEVDARSLPPLRVVLDAGNGMGGLAARGLFARIPGEFVPMDFEPDGSFPNRGGNPLAPANRAGLAARVREERADFGVLWGRGRRPLRLRGRPGRVRARRLRHRAARPAGDRRRTGRGGGLRLPLLPRGRGRDPRRRRKGRPGAGWATPT